VGLSRRRGDAQDAGGYDQAPVTAILGLDPRSEAMNDILDAGIEHRLDNFFVRRNSAS
jgi:hypothetical protein